MSDAVTAEAIGAIDGVNDTFETPVAYWPGTLWHYLNGVLVERDDPTDGLIELGGKDVRLRVAPQSGDTLHFWFNVGAPTGGAFTEPPKAYFALNLVPSGTQGLNLVPGGSSQGEVEYVPGGRAVDLVPEGKAIDLVPIPLSAKEV